MQISNTQFGLDVSNGNHNSKECSKKDVNSPTCRWKTIDHNLDDGYQNKRFCISFPICAKPINRSVCTLDITFFCTNVQFLRARAMQAFSIMPPVQVVLSDDSARRF